MDNILGLVQAVNGLITEVGKLAQMQHDSNVALNNKINTLEARVAEQGARLTEQEAKLAEYSVKNQEQLREFTEVKDLMQATHQIAKIVHDKVTASDGKVASSDGQIRYAIQLDIKDNIELAERICQRAREDIDKVLACNNETPILYDSLLSVRENMSKYMNKTQVNDATECPWLVLKNNSDYNFVFVALFYSLIFLNFDHSIEDTKTWMGGIINDARASEVEKKLILGVLQDLCNTMEPYISTDCNDEDDD